MGNTYLTAAQRAAKRVAQKHLDTAETFEQRNASMIGFCSLVDGRFASGRKLDGKDFQRVTAGLREELSGPSMLELREVSQPATRTRPNGEAFEIYALNRLVREEGGVMMYSLTSTRAYLSKKRFVVDSAFAPIGTSKHLLARALERGLIDDGGLVDIDRAVIDSIGLTTVWQRAYSKGAAPSQAIMVPFGSGALLGRLCAQGQNDDIPMRVDIGRNATRQDTYDARPYHTYADDDGIWKASVLLATAIDESLLDKEQFYLQSELERFQARYGQALREITEAVLWPHAALGTTMPREDVDYCIDRLAAELSEILMRPEHARALRGPRTQPRQWAASAPAVEVDSEPAPALWLKTA